MTWTPSFIPAGLKDSLALIHSGTGPGKEPPAALRLCETRRVLIRKGTHYCGSPQQRLIASRVGPQTWHLCPRAWLNWQTACWLAFSLHPFFLQRCKNKTFILSDWYLFILIYVFLFYCFSLFLIVRQARFVANVILLSKVEAVAASTSTFSKPVFGCVCQRHRTKLKVVAMSLCFGPLLWNFLWCGGIALALTCR